MLRKYRSNMSGFFLVCIEAILIICAVGLLDGSVMRSVYRNGQTLMQALGESFSNSALWFLLFCALTYVSLKIKDETDRADKIFCAVYAAVTVYLTSIYQIGSHGFLTQNKTTLFLSAVLFAGLTLAAILGLNLFRKFIVFFYSETREKSNRIPVLQSITDFSQNHTAAFSFCVILICWLPFVVLRYPGGLGYDEYYQIQKYLGYSAMDQHWPYAHTVLIGVCVDLGRKFLDSASGGLFLYVVLQDLVGAAFLTYSVCAVKKLLGEQRRAWLCLLAIYVFGGIYVSYATNAIKDFLFSCMNVGFVAMLALILWESCSARRLITLSLTGFAMSAIRHNGIYIILMLTLAALLYGIVKALKHKKNMENDSACKDCGEKKSVWKLCGALFFALFVFGIYSEALDAALGPGASAREALAIPFQITARYVVYYEDELSETEKESIDAVLDYDQIAALYDPSNHDRVKDTYKLDEPDFQDKIALVKYLFTCFKLCLRHPGSALQAVASTNYGYFYTEVYQLVIFGDEYLNETGEIRIGWDVPERFGTFTNFLREYSSFQNRFPLTWAVNNIALAIWLTLYLLVKALQRKEYKALLLLIPSIVTILVVFDAPTYTNNGSRYALPIAYAAPFICFIYCGLRTQMRKNYCNKFYKTDENPI